MQSVILEYYQILKFNEKTEETEMAIQLILNIEYEEEDDLCNVSEFMEEFQFLKQYLSIELSELFFADKAIFIEGISEGILLQHFISNMDKAKLKREEETIKINPYIDYN